MKNKCKHFKDTRGHCGVAQCYNNRLEHWPFKKGAKKPVGKYVPHDAAPIHKVHKGLGNPVNEEKS